MKLINMHEAKMNPSRIALKKWQQGKKFFGKSGET